LIKSRILAEIAAPCVAGVLDRPIWVYVQTEVVDRCEPVQIEIAGPAEVPVGDDAEHLVGLEGGAEVSAVGVGSAVAPAAEGVSPVAGCWTSNITEWFPVVLSTGVSPVSGIRGEARPLSTGWAPSTPALRSVRPSPATRRRPTDGDADERSGHEQHGVAGNFVDPRREGGLTCFPWGRARSRCPCEALRRSAVNRTKNVPHLVDSDTEPDATRPGKGLPSRSGPVTSRLPWLGRAPSSPSVSESGSRRRRWPPAHCVRQRDPGALDWRGPHSLRSCRTSSTTCPRRRRRAARPSTAIPHWG